MYTSFWICVIPKKNKVEFARGILACFLGGGGVSALFNCFLSAVMDDEPKREKGWGEKKAANENEKREGRTEQVKTS